MFLPSYSFTSQTFPTYGHLGGQQEGSGTLSSLLLFSRPEVDVTNRNCSSSNEKKDFSRAIDVITMGTSLVCGNSLTSQTLPVPTVKGLASKAT